MDAKVILGSTYKSKFSFSIDHRRIDKGLHSYMLKRSALAHVHIMKK